jgi:hypothetical protein
VRLSCPSPATRCQPAVSLPFALRSPGPVLSSSGFTARR